MFAGTYHVRHAHVSDLPSIYKFYEENPDDALALREEITLIRAVEGDKMVIVVDGDDHIKAAAAVFEHGMDGEHREAGATLIHPQLRGYKLQRPLLQIRFLGEEIFDPDFKTFFSVVRKGHVASLNNLRSVGFIERTPDPTIRRFKNLEGRHYLDLPRWCRHQHASQILTLIEQPHLQGRNGDTMQLHLDVKIVMPVWRSVLRSYSTAPVPIRQKWWWFSYMFN